MKKFKTTVYCALVLSCMLPLQAEVLNWRASTGQQYETKKTVTEYVTMLDTVTTKPTLILKEAVLQETAAQNKSTLDHIKGIPSFPHGSVDVGSKWTASAMLSWNLSGFGFNEPLVIEIPVSYTCTNMEKIEGRTYYRILATWHPFYITDESTARKSSITRISGLSTMSILWDAKSGSPKHIELSEETQYRFNDKSSLVYTRKINDEFRTVMDITRERTISELQEQIVKQKVQNVEVKQTDEGIVLSIENIQFEPDSHVLIDTERKKIGNIGIILATLSDRKFKYSAMQLILLDQMRKNSWNSLQLELAL